MTVKKVLLLIDGSFLSFVVNYRAFKTWSEQYQSLDTCIIRPPDETDQDNLPDIVNESQWFKKCLYNAAVDKLNGIANIIENNTGLLYPNSFLVDTIIAKDSRLTKSFRYGLYPEYKLARKIQRAKRSQYKIGPVFDELYANVFPSIFGEHTMQLAVIGAEGDDVIASIARSERIGEEYERIILISSDRDFIQLQIDRPVTQYGAHGEMVVPKIKKGNEVISITPQQALMVKIISGDNSDNIKPIKPKIGEIRALKYITEKTDEFKKMLHEEPEVAQRFLLNSKLIDFKNIPVELSQAVVDEFYKLRTWE
jgi:5'-3' exonuclease